MILPNFLIIGAAKAGTTSLYYYLQQHPNVFMSAIKEPKFFALDAEYNFQGPGDNESLARTTITSRSDYESLFADAAGTTAIGEASTLYLYHEQSAHRIREAIPYAKLVAILRNPVDRAYSHYLYLRRIGTETASDFGQALQLETNRIDNNWMPTWHYKARGFYCRQLSRYYELFPPEQIRVYLYEELRDDPVQVAQDIFDFLGVDHRFSPDTEEHHNRSGIPKNAALHKFLTRPNRLKDIARQIVPTGIARTLAQRFRNHNLVPSTLQGELRETLTEEYRADILGLQELINKDLGHWLHVDRSVDNDVVHEISKA